MASGSSGRSGGGGGFDFGTDDVLCSYDDFGNQEQPSSNGKQSDPVHSNSNSNSNSNSAKDFRESRMGRSAFLPVYNPSEESFHQELISTVEKTMKKYADNLLRFLEGISARLSQLELYCYNLEKSVGEMRSDLLRENREADSKLTSLEKHLQEVHRSIQILRDKQELADTQKELAKLQLVHKESSHSHSKEEVMTPSSSDLQKLDNPPEVQKQQLALALPHQVNQNPPTSLPPRSVEHPSLGPSPQVSSQNVHIQSQPTYYPQPNQVPTPPLQTQHPQERFLQADSQYQRPQMQISQAPPQPLQSHGSQAQPVQSFSSYQQQWPQQYPQQVQQQQPSPQVQIAPQAAAAAAYPPYPPNQSVNPSSETFPGSMAMQVSLSAIPQAGVGRQEAINYGYAGSNRVTIQPQPPQHTMQRPQQPQTQQNSFGPPIGESAYPVPGPHSSQAPRQGYMVYDGEGGRAPHPVQSHFPQGGYPPPHVSSLQNQLPVRHASPSQMMRGSPYNDLIEKAVSMGYLRDFVTSVIQSMEDSGQPMDFNTLLDRLNMHSSGGSQRAWSG